VLLEASFFSLRLCCGVKLLSRPMAEGSLFLFASENHLINQMLIESCYL
jgi:hypothetical protein